ncbi:ABC transporter substrate-binding protein, partial [Candidatus Aerophobetes bacterium]|nr:ABC transporter substrate-binding protein [Candidatus Aerophobetes bacterium]
PFMHSRGDFSAFQSYRNPIVDELIARGIKELNAEKRRSIYYQLQWIYHEDVPSVPLYQEFLRHYERDWVHGWYYNPIYPGADIQGYLYPIFKR